MLDKLPKVCYNKLTKLPNDNFQPLRKHEATEKERIMKRTKYDAPAPIIGKCDIDKHSIWNKKKAVSKELAPNIIKTLRRGRNAERFTHNGRSSKEAILNQ
jgi:hypothetical protein